MLIPLTHTVIDITMISRRLDTSKGGPYSYGIISALVEIKGGLKWSFIVLNAEKGKP